MRGEGGRGHSINSACRRLWLPPDLSPITRPPPPPLLPAHQVLPGGALCRGSGGRTGIHLLPRAAGPVLEQPGGEPTRPGGVTGIGANSGGTASSSFISRSRGSPEQKLLSAVCYSYYSERESYYTRCLWRNAKQRLSAAPPSTSPGSRRAPVGCRHQDCWICAGSIPGL